jgi:hypothetical protein
MPPRVAMTPTAVEKCFRFLLSRTIVTRNLRLHFHIARANPPSALAQHHSDNVTLWHLLKTMIRHQYVNIKNSASITADDISGVPTEEAGPNSKNVALFDLILWIFKKAMRTTEKILEQATSALPPPVSSSRLHNVCFLRTTRSAKNTSTASSTSTRLSN